LIEYNKENFFKVFKILGQLYNVCEYDINKNKLYKLKKSKIKILLSGKLKNNFYLGQRNIYFLPKLKK